jgi:hypothetical protein
MYFRLGLLGVIILIVYIAIKLLRSPKFDAFCKDLFSGKLDMNESAKDALREIKQKEDQLIKKSKEDKKAAEALNKEAGGIDEHLIDRGVIKAEDKKDEEGSA